MWWNRALLLAVILAITSSALAGDEGTLLGELTQTVHGFYGWVIAHGKETLRSEPHIVPLPHSKRLTLDLSTLDDYSEALMTSGFFAPEFRKHLDDFYRHSSQQLEKYSQADFDEMARDGRSPLLDFEDIDVFFCSQEAEYTAAYVAGAHLVISSIETARATAEVTTPDGWKTKFNFVKTGDRWLISGYCLYQ